MNHPQIMSNQKWSIGNTIWLVFRISPVFTVIHILMNFLNSILPAISVLVNAAFVDTVLKVLAEETQLQKIVFPLVGMLFILLWQNLSGIFLKYGEGNRQRKLTEQLQTAFLFKVSKLPYHVLEQPKTQDLIKRVALTPEKHIKLMMDSTVGICTLLIQNTSVLLIVTTHVWWAGVFMLIGAIPLVSLSLKAGESNYQVQSEVVSQKRKYEYLSKVLLEKNFVLEKTLFSYVPFINEKYQNTFEDVYQKEKKVLKKSMIQMKMGGMVSAAFAIFTMFLLLPGIQSGMLTTGLYISVINAVFSLVNTITWSLSFQMENLAKSKQAVRDITCFWNLPEKNISEHIDVLEKEEAFESLEFSHVHFRYPESDIDILKDLSFKIEAGKHYAFVGKNGEVLLVQQ